MDMQKRPTPWFEGQADFDMFRSILARDDPYVSMEYADWLQKATDREEAVKRVGHTPVRITVKSSIFEHWCKREGVEVRSKFLTGYVIYWFAVRKLDAEFGPEL